MTPTEVIVDTTHIEEQLTRLSAQSSQLNLMLGETAQVLGTLRDHLTHNPIWSAHAQREWRTGIEQAIHDGIAHASLQTLQDTRHSGLKTAVQNLTEHQYLIHQQLNDVQAALDAPLVIQRNLPQGTAQTSISSAVPESQPSHESHQRSAHRPLKRRS